MAYKISDSCISCGTCESECPVGAISQGDSQYEIDEATCISCGSCGYVCPSSIPLVQLFYHAKGELWSRSRRQKQLDATRALAEARAERVERDAREKAEAVARRKAERARVAAAQGEQA